MPFYLGTISVEERDWAKSSQAFIAAADCFDRSQIAIEAQIARIRAAIGSGAASSRQMRQIERRQQQLSTGARMRATAWFNTAAASFNLFHYPDAKQYATRVLDDPQFGDRARDLLMRLPAGTP